MRIELIALDLDGTTLNSEGKMTLFTKETLNRATEMGIHVVIATGRVQSALPEDVLRLPGIEYIITSNGAAITDLRREKLIYENCIAPEALEHVYNLLSTHELMVEVFVKGKAYIEKHIFENLDQVGITESHIRYVRKTRQPYKNVLNMMIKNKENIENININFANKQDRKLIKEKLMELKHITITSSSDHNIEIGGETTSKASALKVLCNKLEVSPECIMACGDSTNDEDMLKVAGLPVAMGNAKDSVKAMAKYITSTNDEDGVAAAIKKFAFK